ncbi:DUF3558 family protein [Gordonia zhaorongruii]|uniref:DUF3558 family protein n=1 Tax=Gordonia zhaorongruii TaxID=2597659 RepID=UPI00104DD122|nr:DUF3558 family protein [Gordonia zhaorongruii]
MRQCCVGVAAIATLVSVSSCAIEGQPISVADSGHAGSVIRQADDNGVRLPFETRHANRWNAANDGTTYEPCTAVSGSNLAEAGLVPSTVADAAGTNGQTLRGCTWDYQRSSLGDSWTLTQIVGNSRGLDSEKRLKSTSSDVWLPDREMDSRLVGVHRTNGVWSCDTYVQSGRAAVSTIVNHFGTAKPDPDEICERALAFTRATIDKMPL